MIKQKINSVGNNREKQIQLDSFGLWYKPYHDETKDSSYDVKSIFELHINLWSKLKMSGCKDDITYLDIGIKVKNYKSVSELLFLCPFSFDMNDICDLSDKMSDKKNVDLVFNNNCELRTKDRYWIIENKTSDNNVEDLLVFSFDQSVDNVVCIEEEVEDKSSKLIIKFDLFRKYIESLADPCNNGCNDSLKEINDVYLRFRITSPELKSSLFSNVEPMNKYFQSGFISTQIIDFKMNSKRNIDDRIMAKAVGNEEKLVKFSKIHFLLMEPSSNNVVFMSENNTTCRNLEKGKWDEYLECSGIENMLVYHWKKSANSDMMHKPIEEFNQLVKINYSKTNPKIIMYISLWFLC